MGQPKKQTNQEILRGKVGTRGKNPMIWFDGHPEAKTFIEDWLKMRKGGKTMWSAQDVLDHLHAEFGYPFRTIGGFTGLLRREWPALYA